MGVRVPAARSGSSGMPIDGGGMVFGEELEVAKVAPFASLLVQKWEQGQERGVS